MFIYSASAMKEYKNIIERYLNLVVKKARVPFSIVSMMYITASSSCSHDKATIKIKPAYCDTSTVTFNKNVLAIMMTHCSSPPFASCHHWATNYSDVKLYVDLGRFQDRVLVMQNMPPPNNIENAPPLSEEELEILRCWVYQGTPF